VRGVCAHEYDGWRSTYLSDVEPQQLPNKYTGIGVHQAQSCKPHCKKTRVVLTELG